MLEQSYTKHYERKFDVKVKQFNHSMELPEYFEPMIADKQRVRIAELGCALVNTIGDKWKDVKVEIECSDKYADDFNFLWDLNGVKPLHPIIYQDMEFLTYGGNSFDIVHCRNALDHTPDPVTAIEEMKRVTKEWIYLEHAQNQKSTYGGHHYWDITLEDGECKFSNGDTWFFLRGFKNYMKGDLIVSIWQKK